MRSWNDFWKSEEVCFNVSLISLLFAALLCWKDTSVVLAACSFFCIWGLAISENKIEVFKSLFNIRFICALLCIVAIRIIGYPIGFDTIVNVVTPIMFIFYIILFLGNKSYEICMIRAKRIIYILAYSYNIENLLSISSYYRSLNDGVINENRRSWFSYFFYVDTPSTGYEIFGLIISSMFAYAIINLFICKQMKTRIQSLVIICFSLLSIWFHYGIEGDRAFLIINILVFIFTFVGLMIFQVRQNKKLIWLFLTIIFIIIIVGICIVLKEIKSKANIWERDGGILNNVRFQAQYILISQWKDSFFGRRNVDIKISSTHNLWFDYYYIGGALAEIPILLYTLFSIKDFCSLFKAKENEKYIFLSVYAAVILWLLTESVVEGSCINISLFFIISSICFIITKKRKEKNDSIRE